MRNTIALQENMEQEEDTKFHGILICQLIAFGLWGFQLPYLLLIFLLFCTISSFFMIDKKEKLSWNKIILPIFLIITTCFDVFMTIQGSPDLSKEGNLAIAKILDTTKSVSFAYVYSFLFTFLYSFPIILLTIKSKYISPRRICFWTGFWHIVGGLSWILF